MLAAVLGSPVAHSLSPVLHNAAYRALGLDGWSYSLHECHEAELSTFVEGLGREWAGLSLTMPLKRVTLEVADEVDPLAAAVGAANTLVLAGRRTAHNTDVFGIGATLGVVAGRAVVLGAGGTAQSALAALRERGITDVEVLVRDVRRTDGAAGHGRAPRRHPAVLRRAERPRAGVRRARRRRRRRLDTPPGRRGRAHPARCGGGGARRGLRAVAHPVRGRGARGGRARGAAGWRCCCTRPPHRSS